MILKKLFKRLAYVHTLVAVSRCQADIAVGGAFRLVLLVQRNGLGKVGILGHAGAGAVLGPLVAPEIIVGVGRLARGPVFLHVRESGGRQLGLAELLRRAVGASVFGIRPKSVNTDEATVVLKSEHVLTNLAGGDGLGSAQVGRLRHGDQCSQHNKNHAKGHDIIERKIIEI